MVGRSRIGGGWYLGRGYASKSFGAVLLISDPGASTDLFLDGFVRNHVRAVRNKNQLQASW
ncbi:MAG: hypothetical protein EBQ92_10640 [Proteobacteria bacterium]|nr:hypothetical protein [Pseudomonadota bacterium]